MTIYKINNFVTNAPDYIVEDQATIDLAAEENLAGTFVIGTESDANNQLALNQSAYLTHRADRFSVVKVVTAGEDQTWVPVDLAIEVDTNADYKVFNALTGTHVDARGLSEVQTALTQIQQAVLASCRLDSVITLTELPVFPKKRPSV